MLDFQKITPSMRAEFEAYLLPLKKAVNTPLPIYSCGGGSGLPLLTDIWCCFPISTGGQSIPFRPDREMFAQLWMPSFRTPGRVVSPAALQA